MDSWHKWVLVVTTLSATITRSQQEGSFNYRDINHWAEIADTCNSTQKLQSPINIVSTQVEYVQDLAGISLLEVHHPNNKQNAPESAAQRLVDTTVASTPAAAIVPGGKDSMYKGPGDVIRTGHDNMHEPGNETNPESGHDAGVEDDEHMEPVDEQLQTEPPEPGHLHHPTSPASHDPDHFALPGAGDSHQEPKASSTTPDPNLEEDQEETKEELEEEDDPVDEPVDNIDDPAALPPIAHRENILTPAAHKSDPLSVPNTMQLSNNGHTAILHLNPDISTYIVGGALGDLYRAEQIHFHWGSTDDHGSEHSIDGHQYPIEMHVVAYDSERYGSVSEAMDGYNSLAVLGVFLEISEEDNPHLAHITDLLDSVIQPGTSVNVESFDVNTLLPHPREHFFRYEGSLTTPPCFESVVWSVFKNTQSISRTQLEKFRQLQEGTSEDGSIIHLQDNFRPVQPVNSRLVYSSFLPEEQISGYQVAEVSDTSNTGQSRHFNWFTLFTLVLYVILIMGYLI